MSRIDSNIQHPAIEDVPTIDFLAIPEGEERDYALRLSDALRARYTNSLPLKAILDRFQLHKTTFLRAWKRFRETHPDKRIWGFRVLVPYVRVTPSDWNNEETRKGGKAGDFKILLMHYPDLLQFTCDELFRKPKSDKIREPRITVSKLHEYFLKECRRQGIPRTAYPFNVPGKARRTFFTFVRDLQLQNPRATVAARYASDALMKMDASRLSPDTEPNVLSPLDVVEFDAYNIDVVIVIVFFDECGRRIKKTLDRLWLLVTLDVSTRAILSYYISVNREYTADDAIICLKRSIIPWHLPELTIDGLHYPESGGIPSSKIQKLRWALWRQLSFDNAKANLAESVRQLVTQSIGASVKAGKVHYPLERAQIERSFRTLAQEYHRLPNTTGSGPQDPKRRNPEKEALKHEIQLEDIEQLTALFVASYNGRPHSSLNGDSPLGCLESFAEDPNAIIKYLPADRRVGPSVLPIRYTCTVVGSLSRGERPFVRFAGVRYTNEVLRSSFGLIRQKFSIWVDHEDLRCVRAFLLDGQEFGILIAHGCWGKRTHDLKTRRLVLALRRTKEIYFSDSEDWYEAYQAYLRKRSHKSKRVASEMLRQRRVQMDTVLGPQSSPAAHEKGADQSSASAPHLPDLINQLEINASDVL